MLNTKELKTLIIDVKKGIYEINGRDVSNSGTGFELTFENGVWSILITEDTIYSTAGNEITLGVKIDSEIDEFLEKAERLRDVLKEANDLIDALASKDLELEIKV